MYQKSYTQKQKTNDHVSIVTLAVVNNYDVGGINREIWKIIKGVGVEKKTNRRDGDVKQIQFT